MTARGTHHQDLTTKTTATLPADSIHVTAPTRPTTIVTIRLHASVPPRERTSTHQPHTCPSRFDHPTLPTSQRRHRDNSPPSRNVRSTPTSHTELHSSPTASNTTPVVPSLSLSGSTAPTQPTNPPVPPGQPTQTTFSISPTQTTQLDDPPQPHIRTLSQPSSTRNYP